MSVNALTGLSCYLASVMQSAVVSGFNALTGLSCYFYAVSSLQRFRRFNALTGLSCYSPIKQLPDN